MDILTWSFQATLHQNSSFYSFFMEKKDTLQDEDVSIY